MVEDMASPEKVKLVDKVYLFDVDGVLTDPKEKINTEPRIIDEIAKRLEIGEPVALVTGRSTDFIRERVTGLLRNRISEPAILQNFFAVGEKGGVSISYDDKGQEEEDIDQDISVPQNLAEDVRGLIETEFIGIMFFDDSKKTMISTEMKDGGDLDKYHQEQESLIDKMNNLVSNYGLEGKLEIDPTTIATDIQNKTVGKDFAARRVLEWLSEKGIKPQKIIAFGDSKSDIAMAQEAQRQGFEAEMIFVGRKEDVTSLSMGFPIITTNGMYEKGALEYLQNSH